VKTVAVLNEKGGSGKTTIATNLASAWHAGGREVLLLDADPQLTALDWSDTEDTDGVPVVHLGDSSLEDDLPRVGESFELVVIDGAPRMGSLTASAVRVSDLVVIPVQPTAADIWSAETVVDVCETYSTPAVIALSRAVVGTKEADEATEALQSFGLPVLNAQTSQRIAYSRALGQGKSVLDLPSAEKAAAEIRSLSDEALSHLNRHANE
jgi:chromosome partitioning protein